MARSDEYPNVEIHRPPPQGRPREATQLQQSQRAPARPALREPAAPARAQDRRGAALGWLSIGLGAAQLIAPRQMARLIGADEQDDATSFVLRLIGSRELLCGVGLLSQSHPRTWAWGRVAGDVMDLALLGSLLPAKDTRNDRLLVAGAAVLGVGCLDAYAALRSQGAHGDLAREGLEVHETVTIARPPEEVYAFFRDFQNLPRFMSHLESVRVNNGHSHWCAKGPLGTPVEWDAEIVEDLPGKRIVWRSVPNADIANQGRVEFRPLADQATELDVVLRYDPPVGKVGAAIATLFGVEPSQQISGDLRKLKQVLETGEVLHSDASIHRGMHPARPSERSLMVSKEVRS